MNGPEHFPVEKLGTFVPKLPPHWRVCRLKDVATLVEDVLPENTGPDYEFRYVDIGNVSSQGRIIDTDRIVFGEAPSRARRRVVANDTIISTVRTYLKAVALIEPPADDLVVSTGFAVLHPKSTVHPAFLWRVLQSEEFVGNVVSHSEGVSYPAIAPGKLMALPFWFPPSVDEQSKYLSLVDSRIEEIDGLIGRKRQVVSRLLEYRSALISAAVTGKLNAVGGGS